MSERVLILNFAHPFTDEQVKSLEESLGAIDIYHEQIQLDPESPFLPQIREILERVPLTADQWQTVPLVINPPALSAAAVIMAAEITSRAGYLPPVIRLKRVESTPPKFVLAEIVRFVD